MTPSNPVAPPSDDEPIAALVFEDDPIAAPTHSAATALPSPVSLLKPGTETNPSLTFRAPAPSANLADPVHAMSAQGMGTDPAAKGPPPSKDLTHQALLPARGVLLAPEHPPTRQLTTAPPIARPQFRSMYAGKTLVQCIAPALLQPLLGGGPAWIALLAGGTLVAGLSVVLGAIMMLGKAFFGFVLAATVVLYARFFGVCLSASAHEYDDPGNLPDMSQFKHEIGLPLLAIGLWWLLATMPAIVWVMATGNTSGVVLTALLCLAFAAWPLAMTVSALRRRPLLSMFDFEVYPKMIMAAPAAWAIVFAVLIGMYVLTGFLGGLVRTTFSNVIGGAITLLIIPYLHGVAGALVGRLLVDNPAVGEAAGADI